MREPPLTGADVLRLREELAEAATPTHRLRSLLVLAQVESGLDARRALAFAEEAAALASETGDDSAYAEASYLQGHCANLLLDHDGALAAYDCALRGFEARGEERADRQDAAREELHLRCPGRHPARPRPAVPRARHRPAHRRHEQRGRHVAHDRRRVLALR